jgi:hypothetical protein
MCSYRYDELMENRYGVFAKISLNPDSFRASSPKEDYEETHGQQIIYKD